MNETYKSFWDEINRCDICKNDADARSRVLAVARTIANLDGNEQIEPRHLCEAINYRMLRRGTS